MAVEYGIVSCDDLIPGEVKYTYHHDALQQKSFIDHLFIGPDLKDQILNVSILENPLNVSDHLPLSFFLKVVDNRAAVPAVDHNRVREYRWDKGDLAVYYANTGNILSRVKHDFCCEGLDASCDDSNHRLDLEIYYAEVVHALHTATYNCIPRVPRSALKHYWSAALDDLKANSKDTFDIWVLCGKPNSGTVFDIMKDAKYKYKMAVRHAIKSYEQKFSDELYEHLLSKDMSNFWRVWSSKVCNKITSARCIDGEVDDHMIAEVFCKKFSELVIDPCPLNSYCDEFHTDESVQLCLLSVEEVDSVIRNHMKRGKAAGIDNLTLEHIIHSHPIVVWHLARLFNLMLKHGYVPNQFGRGIVIPLIKDKHADLTNSNNYRGITISPVISKIFEGCLLMKFESYLYSNDLQLGFKKNLGCGPALFTVQQVVKYFTSRGSTVFVTAVDASKAFDRLDHNILLAKLRSRKLPNCFIRVIACWYSKLYSSVVWNSFLSTEFRVRAGVRQGGILSPILFNLYVDDLIVNLKVNGDGCHVGSRFLGCVLYADDLLLLSPSVIGLQKMLDICSIYGTVHNIQFNPNKTVSVAIGKRMSSRNVSNVSIDDQPIPWVDQLKYLGVTFNVNVALTVDVSFIKRKFYAALNSLFVRCSGTAEPVKVQLVKSFCLPLLTYCIGALELSRSAINELAVCWNDAFRKIFNYNRWESVKQLQYFCGCLDFGHMYDLARYKFMSHVSSKLQYLMCFYASLELQFHSIVSLYHYYVGASESSFVAAVYGHFEQCTLSASS